MKTTVDALT